MAQTENPYETLMEDSRCAACIPDGKKWDVIITILAKMANITLTRDAVETLMEESACGACIPEGKKLDVIITLLSSGGVGGGATVSTSSPTGTGNDGDLWFQSTTHYLWIWSGAAWVQLIGP